MKIQQIRNATIRIECAGKHFLIEPLVSKEGYRYERTLSRSGEGENSIPYN